MKRLFQTGTREESLNIVILFVRISIAALMISHGLPKLSKLLAGGEIQFGDPIGLGPTLSLILVVFSEIICSVCIGIGLGTRLASIPLIFRASSRPVIFFTIPGFGMIALSIDG